MSIVFLHCTTVHLHYDVYCFYLGQEGQWGYGKPDNYDDAGQTCAVLDGVKLDGKYNDEDCYSVHGHICENIQVTGMCKKITIYVRMHK